MLGKKKGQASLEFILIFLFVFVLVSIMISIVGYYFTDINENNKQKELDNFASSIEREVNLLQRVEPGYNRSVEIPDHFIDRYNLTLVENYVVLVPMEYVLSDDPVEYWYPLPLNNTYYLTTEDRDGNGLDETYLILSKNSTHIRDNFRVYE